MAQSSSFPELNEEVRPITEVGILLQLSISSEGIGEVLFFFAHMRTQDGDRVFRDVVAGRRRRARNVRWFSCARGRDPELVRQNLRRAPRRQPCGEQNQLRRDFGMPAKLSVTSSAGHKVPARFVQLANRSISLRYADSMFPA